MAKLGREDGFHCKCPGNPPSVPPYIIAVPSGGCEGACQGGVRTPDNSVAAMSNRRRTSYSNMSGMGSSNVAKMSVGAFALSMVSVGVLFYVIGYGYYKGQESA